MHTSSPQSSTQASPRMPLARLIAAMALTMMTATLATSAAVAGEESTSSEAVASGAPAASAAQTADPTVIEEPEPPATATTDPVEPQFWSDVLAVGDCIIRPAEGDLPEPLPCDQMHGEEIYAIGRLDFGSDEPYPGDAIFDMVGEQLCDEATAAFGGETWDLLPFSTFWLFPIEAEWDAGDRGIMCSAAPPEGIDLKIGSAAGGSLDSDDVLLARGGFSNPELGEISEWVALDEHATISSVGIVTEGQFDIPLRRARAVPQGFMFNATARGDEAPATTTWGYSWDSGEFTDLGSVLPGWELSSMMSMNDTLVFAGRSTPEDDWDLFTSTSEAGVVAIADGPGDQHYPAFSPDGKHVVFHDAGDLVVIDVDGSNERVLVERGSSAFESAVAPDGTSVAFASDHAGNDDIWLVDFDGGDPVNLTEHPANEAWPVWSADGSRIYFNTDRLRPENRVSSLMMMNADGSDPSWFSGASVGQALVLDRALAGDVIEGLPTIEELYQYELVEGEPGTTTRWQHSSGRLSVDLPAGWRVAELDDGVGFIAAPRPARYNDSWEADGVVVTLRDDLPSDDFFALVDETAAVLSCERFDGSDGVQAVDDVLNGWAANHVCGDQDAVAGVIALYNDQTGVGVVIEGQRDNLPDVDSDREMLDAIAQSLAWD